MHSNFLKSLNYCVCPCGGERDERDGGRKALLNSWQSYLCDGEECGRF